MDLLGALRAAATILKKRKIQFSLTGGLAANAWLPDERTRETHDVDFAVFVDDLQFVRSVQGDLEEEGIVTECGLESDLKNTVMIRLYIRRIAVDFVMPKDFAYVKVAFRRAGRARVLGKSLAVLLPEDVFLYKALARRPRDLPVMADLADLKGFDRRYVERWGRTLGIWSFAKRALG